MVFVIDFFVLFRIAWEGKNEVHFRPTSGELFYSFSVTDSEHKRQSVKDQAVKIARSISVFGICPGVNFINILHEPSFFNTKNVLSSISLISVSFCNFLAK